MEIVEILDIINENKKIKTFKFKWPHKPKPGQFIMAWLPGTDEIPLAISYSDEMSGITIEALGEATMAFHDLGNGERIGIRGPYGNGFNLEGDDFLLISGGTGAIPLARAAETLNSLGKSFKMAMGARTSEDLFFVDRMKGLGEVQVATDDGSLGHHGFVTQIAEKLIVKKKPSMILACGPEPMMAAALDVAQANDVPIQCSLERYMKCGFGICGSCQCGKYTVCRDGPVFTGQQLLQIEDFGNWKRDASGNRVMF